MEKSKNGELKQTNKWLLDDLMLGSGYETVEREVEEDATERDLNVNNGHGAPYATGEKRMVRKMVRELKSDDKLVDNKSYQM